MSALVVPLIGPHQPDIYHFFLLELFAPWFSPTPLLAHFNSDFMLPVRLVGLHQSDTPVPAQDGLIVLWRTNLLSFFVAPHGFFQQNQQGVRRAPCA